MKSRTLWIIAIVVLVIVVIGCMTNWFGLKKNVASIQTPIGGVTVNTPSARY